MEKSTAKSMSITLEMSEEDATVVEYPDRSDSERTKRLNIERTVSYKASVPGRF